MQLAVVKVERLCWQREPVSCCWSGMELLLLLLLRSIVSMILL